MKAPHCVLRLSILGFLCLPSACVPEQTSADALDRLAGMWRLASWESHFEDGTSQEDPRTASYIVYSPTGHMCWVAMDPNRPQWTVPTAPTQAEALSGIMGFGAYCGTVEVNAEERFVLHHVEIERSPNNVGITRKRFFEFRGPNEILLTVDPAELAAPLVGMTLVWQRVVR